MKRILTTVLLAVFLAGVHVAVEAREVGPQKGAPASGFFNGALNSLTLQEHGGMRMRRRGRRNRMRWIRARRGNNWNRRRGNDNWNRRRWNRNRRWRNR